MSFPLALFFLDRRYVWCVEADLRALGGSVGFPRLFVFGYGDVGCGLICELD